MVSPQEASLRFCHVTYREASPLSGEWHERLPARVRVN